MAGGKIDILVEPDTKGFSGKLDAGLRGAMGKAAGIGAGIAAALGTAQMGKDIVKLGMDLDTAMNNLRAVSGATSAELASMREHAKELGQATDLVGTSTTDAVDAMLELSRGGFSVEQAMDGAKGSLQLATAAQIEVGQAAEMTSTFINTFGLEAADAGRVADVLAGAANAAAGEIPDMALGMQQAGTVASMFGISMEETTTALAMFANAGISGSDAGTSLKTMLTMLANPSKQAQEALDELGVAAFDAKGEFVGLPELFEQLGDAKERMSQEDFNQAAAAAFGTDAIRAAGVGAQAAGDNWDKLYEQITRTGSAAKMAEAQTQGLPGIKDRLENTLEGIGTDIYEDIQPTLVRLGTLALDTLEDVGPQIEGFVSGIASTVEDLANSGKLEEVFNRAVVTAKDLLGVAKTVVSVVESVAGFADKLGLLSGPGLAAGAGLLLSKYTGLAPKIQASAKSVGSFNDAIRLQKTLAAGAGEKISTMSAAWGELGRRHQTVANMTTAYKEGSRHMQRWGANAALAAAQTTGFQSAAYTAATKVTNLGDKVGGVAKAGASVVRTGAGGLMGFLGGPWGVAITAATTALGYFYSKHQEEQAKLEQQKSDINSLAQTYDQLTGAATEATDAMLLNNIKSRNQNALIAMRAGITDDDMLAAVKGGKSSESYERVIHAAAQQAQDMVKGNAELKQAFKDAGQSTADLAAAIESNDEERFNEITSKVANQFGIGGTRKMNELMKESGLADLGDFMDEMIKNSEAAAAATEAAGANAVNKLKEQQQNLDSIFDTMGNRAAELKGSKLEFDVTGESDAQVQKLLDDLEQAGVKAKAIDGKISIDTTDVVDAFDLVEKLGLDITRNLDGTITLDTDEAVRKADELGLKVKQLPDGRFAIDLDDSNVQQWLAAVGAGEFDSEGNFTLNDNFDDVQKRLDAIPKDTKGNHTVSDNTGEVSGNINTLQDKNTHSTHTITVVEQRVRENLTPAATKWKKMTGQMADGAFTTAASGYLSQQQAMMAPGGSWLLWAEDETEGESFIPHARSKRKRSMEILRKTAELFGLDLVDKAGRVVQSNGSNTDAIRSRYAGGGFNHGMYSYTAGQSVNIPRVGSYAVADIMEVTSQHVQAVATMEAAEKDLSDTRDQFAREVEDVKDKEKALADARKSAADADRGIGDAHDSLADANKDLARAEKELADKRGDSEAKAEDIEDAEDRVKQARKRVEDASRGIADAEERQSEQAEAVRQAEQDLAEARETVASQSERAAKAQRQYIAGYITAAGQAIEQIMQIGTSVADMVATRFAAQADYFKAMGEVADSVDQLRQHAAQLRMDSVRLRMDQLSAFAANQQAELNLARTRSQGIDKVAEAQAQLEAARAAAHARGLTGVGALGAAMDEFYRTGQLRLGQLTDDAVDNSAEVRAALANLAAVEMQAKLDELNATKDKELAALDYTKAVYENQAAVMELSITTEALHRQAALLGGLTTNQANSAAAALDGKERQGRGSSSILSGIGTTLGGAAAGGAAGFALGGPAGAAIGALLGLTVGGFKGAGEFRSGITDIKVGKYKEQANKAELDKYLASMTAEERRRYTRDGAYAGGEFLRTDLERMQREQADKQAAFERERESNRLALDARRLQLENDYTARASTIEATRDFYEAQKKIAESTNPEQAKAAQEMAEIALQMRDASISMQTDLRSQNDSVIRELVALRGYAEQEAKLRGSSTGPVSLDFTLPPGEAFTREQTKAMFEQFADAANIRLNELEAANEPSGTDYFYTR